MSPVRNPRAAPGWVTLTAAVAVAGCLVTPGSRAIGAAAAADQATDWPVYHGDPEGTHFSPLRQIHRRNVHRLRPAWIYRCDDSRVSPPTTIAIVFILFTFTSHSQASALERKA